MTEAVKMLGPASTMQEFLKKLLKRKADVRGGGGGLTKCATSKTRAVEAANLQVFVGVLKGYAELKLFHSMLKYKYLFVAQNISGDVIAFMGDHPL